MALQSNQITPKPQKSSKDKLTSAQIKLHNVHTINDKNTSTSGFTTKPMQEFDS